MLGACAFLSLGFFLWMSSKMTVSKMMNRYGLRGHPFLIPANCLFVSDVENSSATLKHVSSQIHSMILHILSGIPNLSRALISLFWFTLSNAFSQSSNVMTHLSFEDAIKSISLLIANSGCCVLFFPESELCSSNVAV